MAKKFLTLDIKKLNEEIFEIENLLKESMNFACEEDFDDTEFDNDVELGDNEMQSDKEPVLDIEEAGKIDSYIDNIRKYSLNGLSALCDYPESEEYQMLKKIFQMCDKKPEKKDNISESHRLFGVLKENKKVIFEANIDNTKDFTKLKRILTSEAKSKGLNPSDIRLVSENKIII